MSWFDFSSVEFMALSVASSTPSWRRRSLREMDTALSHRSQRMYSTQQSEGGRRGERDWCVDVVLLWQPPPQVYPAIPECDCWSQNSCWWNGIFQKYLLSSLFLLPVISACQRECSMGGGCGSLGLWPPFPLVLKLLLHALLQPGRLNDLWPLRHPPDGPHVHVTWPARGHRHGNTTHTTNTRMIDFALLA